MRDLFRASVLSLAIAGVCFVPSRAEAQLAKPATQPAAAGQADVPVKVVVLFSSGVGYFQREGAIDGNARVDTAIAKMGPTGQVFLQELGRGSRIAEETVAARNRAVQAQSPAIEAQRQT